MTKRVGRIIAIDGPDGVGKSTQVKLLAEYFERQNTPVHTTRASGGTPIGEELRKASLSPYPRPPEVDLYISLAMHTALGFDLQQRKAKGETVIVDRSPLAVVAYQVFGSQLPDPKMGYDACEEMLRIWQIDDLIVLDAAQSVLDARRRHRVKDSDYFEEQSPEYHRRVKDGYEAAVSAMEKLGLPTSFIHIDASGSESAVYQQIIGRLALSAKPVTG